MNVNASQLWEFLSLFYMGNVHNYDTYLQEKDEQGEEPSLDSSTYSALLEADIQLIVLGDDYDTDDIGGLLVDVCDQTVAEIANGYAIFSWQGPSKEAMVIGYKASELTINSDSSRE